MLNIIILKEEFSIRKGKIVKKKMKKRSVGDK